MRRLRLGLLGYVVTAAAVALAVVPVSEPAGAGAHDAPGVQRILVVGDSAADSLTPYLRQAAAPLGIEVFSAAIPGCGVIDGVTVDATGSPFIDLIYDTGVCPGVAPRLQVEKVAEHEPDLVIWLSGWETWPNRILDGRMVEFGTIEGNLAIAGAVDRAVQRLTAAGGHVVMLPLAPNAFPNEYANPVDPEDTVAKQKLAGLMRSYGRHHTDTTSVVDLADLLCPGGPPCPDEVAPGIRPRPVDGYHFEGPGATWLAERILDLALAPAPAYALSLTLPVPCTNAGIGDSPPRDPGRCA